MAKSKKLSDIAKELGVSVVTVSNALNDRSGVSDEMRAKIKELASKIQYKNEVLKEKAHKKTDNIAVLVSERQFDSRNMTQSFYLGFYENFSRCFLLNDYCAILVTIAKAEEDARILPKLIVEKKVEGIILLGKIKQSYVERLSETGIPMVLVDFYYDELPYRCVLTDNIEGSYEVTKLLIKKGHREIGFVGTLGGTSSINDRYIGYYKAMFEHNLKINENYIIPDRDEQGVYNLDALPEKLPTAFVCNSDRAAYELYQKLKLRGLRVGEDVSVVGFDDDIFARLCEPKLTTVAVNVSKITHVAEEILISEIEQPTGTSGKVSVPGTIILRQSIRDLNE